MKRWLVQLAMVILYAAVAVGAANCLVLESQEQSHEHHHSSSHTSHSTLCAWGCQVHPTETLPAGIPFIVGFVFIAMRWLIYITPSSLLLSTISRSRAPPSVSRF